MKTAVQTSEASGKGLAEMARAGDLEAFNQLVLQHQDMAFDFAFTILNDLVLAEAATQESFLEAFRNRKMLQKGSFHTWLLALVARTAFRLSRSQKQPSFHHARAEKGRLDQALVELPVFARCVLTLVDGYGLPYREVAGILGVAPGVVKSSLAQARLQVKEMRPGDPLNWPNEQNLHFWPPPVHPGRSGIAALYRSDEDQGKLGNAPNNYLGS